MLQQKRQFGLGDPNAQFNVYIGNYPSISEYSNLDLTKPLSAGEIHSIGQACGNGWRKVFNVYAKLVFALNAENIVALQGAQSWQEYRDHTLLQSLSNTNLLFSPPQLIDVKSSNSHSVYIVMGKTYAKSLNLPCTLHWLDHEFALNTHLKLLVCPYFDYRQLSNIKIIRLVKLIQNNF
ncbi:hypothetical protein [uncultured Paraglaciecola sp.]|uniref:DUF6942 family protein n=1 Tax=uncultured Paraglaciecola sp. TaxID=1765024 RepID=UPI002631346F|nr:hypothetical protein [uncultured Paraglaciecola sp.]